MLLDGVVSRVETYSPFYVLPLADSVMDRGRNDNQHPDKASSSNTSVQRACSITSTSNFQQNSFRAQAACLSPNHQIKAINMGAYRLIQISHV